MKLFSPRALPMVLISLLWGGCTTTYEVKVDSISQPKAKEALSYRLKSKNPGVAIDDTLRDQEAAKYVKTALSGKGMYEAPTPELADVVVELDYGIEPPHTRMDRSSVPVFAQVGGGVRYTQVPVSNGAGGMAMRTVATYEPPRTELIGFQDVVTPVTVYEKYLNITARENKAPSEGKPPAEVWSVHASTEDESNDLRKYLPIITSASIDYIGKDSATQQVVKVKEKDGDVAFIKKGM